MLHDALAKCSANLTADGLTSQVCSISLPVTCYMRDVSTLAACSRLSHTSSYPLVHQDGRHAQKYHGVMQTYLIFHHMMKTLYKTLEKGIMKIM